MSYLMRVSLPDRPGSLGELATSLGHAGIDIHAVDVVDRRPDGTAVDDVLVSLPGDQMPDSAVSACHKVAGVSVDYVAPYPAGASLARDLEVVEAMADRPGNALECLVEALPALLRYGWAVHLCIVDDVATIGHRSLGAPTSDGFTVPWLPTSTARMVAADPSWAPASWQGATLAVAPMWGHDGAIVLGRPGGPAVLASELARLTHLVSLAGIIASGSPSGDLRSALPG